MSWRAVAAGVVLGLAVAAVPEAGAQGQEANDRITIKGTGIYRKVIVSSDQALLHEKPGDKGEPVAPFLVFHKLKATPDGKEEKDGMVRVGKATGKELGWIKKDFVIDWDTRDVLDPQMPAPDGTFTVFEDKKLGGKGFEFTGVKGGHKCLAPILNKPENEDDPIFNVAIFTGGVKGATTQVASGDVPLKDMKLEVMFVIDTTQSMTPLLEGMKEVVKSVVTTLAGNPRLKGSFRFGLVEYQDATPGLTPANLVSPLTGDLDGFLSKIQPLRVAPHGSEETKEDVLAGLKMAIERGGWDKVSSKHIILLGDASAHIKDCTKEGSGCRYCDAMTGVCKKNTTGLDVTKVINLGRRVAGGEAGTGEAARQLASINFHAVRALQGEDPENDGPIAQRQFQAVAANNGEFQGGYKDVDPNKMEDRAAVVAYLTKILTDSLQPLSQAQAGATKPVSPEQMATSTPVAQAIYRIINATAGDTKAVSSGFAKRKSPKRTEVARERVLISQVELVRLRSTLELLFNQFKDRVEPDERGNIEEILTVLQQAVAGAATGQIVAKTSLKEAIDMLPLRSDVMDITAEKLKGFTAQDFKLWLNKVNETIDRAKKLEEKSDWMFLSGEKVNEKYTFLLQAELP